MSWKINFDNLQLNAYVAMNSGVISYEKLVINGY